MNLSTTITGHNLIQPSAADAPLDFNVDPNLVGKFRAGLAVMVAKRDNIQPAKADEPQGVYSASDLGLTLQDLEDAA